MRKSTPKRLPALAALLLAGLALGQAQRKEIEVDVFGAGKVKAIPIAIEGFSGETLALLKFDLFVQGFEFVDKAKAQFTIKGSNAGTISGTVYDHVKRESILKRRYKGGSLRKQAHTFANNTVEAITGSPGIGLTRIAFKQKHDPHKEIHVADFDGHNATRLTHDNSNAAGPGWTPNNNTLYYCTYHRHNPDIWSHNVKTGARQEVVRFSGTNSSPAVSPDGRRLAMVLSKAGSPDIWVGSAANGTGLRRLTTTKEAESSPCWSPDGRWICFTSRAGGGTRLYKIPANGGAMSRIQTTGVFNATEPDWSPDGKAIAFTTMRGGGVFEICIVPPGGGNVEVLATGEDPSWAPNSRTLIFTSRSGGKRFLSVLDVPTKRVKTLPHSFPGDCSQAAWSK